MSYLDRERIGCPSQRLSTMWSVPGYVRLRASLARFHLSNLRVQVAHLARCTVDTRIPDMSEEPTPQGTDPEPTNESIESLQAENDALRAQLDGHAPKKSGSGIRRFFGWVAAIIAIILIALAVSVGWAKTTLLDTDAFVATMGSLASDEAVAEALSIEIGNAIVEATELEAAIAEALPEELTFVSAPVAAATGTLVARVANEIILSDAFSTVWNTALRVTHTTLMFVLTGDGAVVSEGGSISIDLDTIAEPVIDAVSERGLDVEAIVGEDFTLGQITIVESDYLGQAQEAVRYLEMLGWITVLLAIVAIGVAMLVGPDRRRMVAILGFGTAIAGLINLISLRLGRSLTVGSIGDEVDRSAGLAVWDAVTGSLTSLLWALVLLAFIVGFAAWFVGPGPRATRLRDSAGDGVDRWRGTTQEPPTGLSLFFYKWRRPLEWGVVGIGLVILLIMPIVSFASAIIVVLIAAAAIAAIELVAGPQTVVDDEPADDDSDVKPANVS